MTASPHPELITGPGPGPASPPLWISHEGLPAEARSSAFWARGSWTASDPDDGAVLRIAAESHYRLWVNGTFVGTGPARGARTVNFVDSHPVGRHLRQGPNSIMVAVQAPGWPTFRASPALPAVWVELPGRLGTGPDWQTRPMPGWRTDPPTFTFQHGPMEWVDLADGPDQPPGERPDWQPALPITAATAATDPARAALLAKELRDRDIPLLAETTIAPVAIPVVAAVPRIRPALADDVAMIMQHEPYARPERALPVDDLVRPDPVPVIIDPEPSVTDLVVVIDFGREVNGAFRLDLDAPAGTTVDLGYGEHLADGRVRTVVGGYRFADRQLTRAGRQTVGTWFDERGFRYVQVALRNLTGPVTIHRVSATDRRYPFPAPATFVSDDDQLDAVWELCRETIAVCATDTFVDCPWRENTLYINDLLVENVVALAAFGDGRLTARSLRLALAEADPAGLVPASVPNGLQPGMDRNTADAYMTFPATQLYLSEIVEDLLLYSGDLETATALTEHLIGTLDHLEGWRDDAGLLQPPAEHWNFVDWAIDNEQAHALRGRACASVNWFWVRALDAMTRLADWTGAGADRVPAWRRRADELTVAIKDRFWSADRQVFTEGARDDRPAATQLSQALAILSGRVEPAAWPRLDGAGRSPSELYMLHYVLQAELLRDGMPAALARIRRHWGAMVDAESPTVWECGVTQSGASAFGGAGSLCHGFATTPLPFLQRSVLGVRPTAPGFARFALAPDLGDLDRAGGTVPTPHGTLKVRWQRTGDRLDGSVTVPDGIVGTLPDGTALAGGTHTVRVA
ncbi:family 78 glycoside hydrolase catalytic domain [Microlunatus sp. GCM10028923]|uniref:family 78 glycoside hydrolase catalytic domain n=1 Tax=Microlunatus sp. GCM10028923 TaxID=3273400 RepID=UPI0036147849